MGKTGVSIADDVISSMSGRNEQVIALMEAVVDEIIEMENADDKLVPPLAKGRMNHMRVLCEIAQFLLDDMLTTCNDWGDKYEEIINNEKTKCTIQTGKVRMA